MSDDDKYSELHTKMKKRNRVLGASLFIFVISLAVISYFRIKGLTP